MNSSASLTLALPLTADTSLRAAFFRTSDRWSHTMDLVHSGETIALFTSLEGTSADDWPPSPPLQEVHLEDRPNGQRVALAVGRAGRSHWSASIETQPETSGMCFDIACRTAGPPDVIGSRYRLAPEVSPVARDEHAQPGELLFRVAKHTLAISSARYDGGTLFCGPTEVPRGWPATGWPATLRWTYTIRLLLPASATA